VSTSSVEYAYNIGKCVAVCGSVLQCVFSLLLGHFVSPSSVEYAYNIGAVCCNMLQYVLIVCSVCCSVLQCGAG